ncbi:hypothetical protein JCGZ_18918 [Jatropha curcas]|uniref:Uncharacterized protein n=1 Tax=Jatropha curcas TaxID=180498 RepID=A0A067JYH9_JATCU|nr:hypothetical protein JCGZ_18918 [Jatropha curcas]
MARQNERGNLAKIGLEAFSAVDEYLARSKRLGTRHPHQINPLIPVIDSNEAAKRYGGKVFMDYPKAMGKNQSADEIGRLKIVRNH